MKKYLGVCVSVILLSANVAYANDVTFRGLTCTTSLINKDGEHTFAKAFDGEIEIYSTGVRLFSFDGREQQVYPRWGFAIGDALSHASVRQLGPNSSALFRNRLDLFMQSGPDHDPLQFLEQARENPRTPGPSISYDERLIISNNSFTFNWAIQRVETKTYDLGDLAGNLTGSPRRVRRTYGPVMAVYRLACGFKSQSQKQDFVNAVVTAVRSRKLPTISEAR